MTLPGLTGGVVGFATHHLGVVGRSSLSFKTASEQECHRFCWDFCRQAHAPGLNPSDLSQAILGLGIKLLPIPAGASIKMLPDTLPSHPKGHNARIFQDPWCKRATLQPMSLKKNLLWRAAVQCAIAVTVKAAPAPPPYPPKEVKNTMWGWPIFWEPMVKDNADTVRLSVIESTPVPL